MEVTTHSLKLNKHNLAKVDKLIEQFVVDYNYNMQLANEERIKANEGEKNKHILNIKVEFTQKDSYSFRDVDWAINFWKGYIDQIRGHKVIEIKEEHV